MSIRHIKRKYDQYVPADLLNLNMDINMNVIWRKLQMELANTGEEKNTCISWSYSDNNVKLVNTGEWKKYLENKLSGINLFRYGHNIVHTAHMYTAPMFTMHTLIETSLKFISSINTGRFSSTIFYSI